MHQVHADETFLLLLGRRHMLKFVLCMCFWLLGKGVHRDQVDTCEEIALFLCLRSEIRVNFIWEIKENEQ